MGGRKPVFAGISPEVGVEVGRQKTWNQHQCLQNLQLQLLLVNIISNIYNKQQQGDSQAETGHS